MSEEIKKQYLNIWEQVEKNKDDIKSFVEGAKTLADFGIRVIGYVSDPEELPDPDEYLQDGGEYGDAIAIAATEEPPYEYYVFTRPFEEEESPQWFNIGEFPKAGPQGPAGQDGEQGERGERGPIGPQGPKGATGNTGATGPAGPAPTIGENGNWYRDGVDTGLPSRGPQGEQGEPGSFFHVKGQVASSSLLPAAADVDIDSAYMVGASAPYDVYVIMDVSGTHYWLNLGPVAVIQSDTKVGSLTFSATGTLSAEILNAIANTSTEDFLKIGDRYFVKQSAGNYYAMKRDSGQVLVYCMAIDMSTGEWVITTETMCDLDTAQTISGVKNLDTYLSFKNEISLGNVDNTSILSFKRNGVLTYAFATGAFHPYPTDNKNLGTSSYNWKDGYFSGQVYAENTFNVINASEMTDGSHVSQEQYDILTNGKPTFIKGTFLSKNNVVAFLETIGTNSAIFIYLGSNDIGSFVVQISDKFTYVRGATDPSTFLRSIGYFNGKEVPVYPTTNTSPQVLTIAASGGALSWGNVIPTNAYETNQSSILYYETINNISIDANRTFTLQAGPANTYPEYRANITNSGATDIVLTFTGVSVIKTNDEDITIVSNVLTLPTGTTIEVSIQNGKMIAFNWSV